MSSDLMNRRRHSDKHRQRRPFDKIEITSRSPAELKPHPDNPRQHTRRQIQQLAHSIETFGFIVPVLVDAESNVIAGHGRLLAARELGMTQVPTICLHGLNENQKLAFMIADNRLTENSSWNENLLAQHLKSLSAVDLDFDIEVTGFAIGEIDIRIEGLNIVAPNSDDPADARRAEAQSPGVTKLGDIWQLGRHRLLCGSALETCSYDVLMGSERAAMLFTDPPYNVRISGHVCGLGAIRHREFAMASGEMDRSEFCAFLSRVFSLAVQHSRSGSIHFVCMDWRHLADLLVATRSIYSELKNICIWTKDNPGMGSFYRSQHEMVCVFKYGKKSNRNNIQLGIHGRNRSNVWAYRSVSSFGRESEEGKLLALHPTVKPVALVADAILDCSSRGELILDPFAGSGTTIIAAERTGRRCFGIEIDPKYVDTIVRRFQAYTGLRATNAVTGSLFNDIETGARHAEP